MSNQRYPQEFKTEAVKQITERGHKVADVSARLGVSQHSLYQWIKAQGTPAHDRPAQVSQTEELRRLKAELKRVTEERDILKKGRSVLCQAVRVKYAFIKRHEGEYSIRRLCKVMAVHPSGYYAWKAQPMSLRAKDDQRLLGLLKHAWLESGGVYGYRKLTMDMRDLGESCGKHRVARLLKIEGLRSQTGYKRRAGMRGGKPAIVAPNHLQRRFAAAEPNQAWVTDITYIRTHEGWLYLAVVVDLFSRQVVGWSMGSRIDTGLVLDALLMALWRRRPKLPVMVHSDQGSQFTGHDWQGFLRDHNLVSSMSRRGNCHDNAVAESFFQLLKRERIRRQIYPTRDEARADVFNYIEMFYNPKRRHGTAGDISPVEFERRHSQRLNSV
ncbi:IS3 family transposase [Diaphorobacter sp. HDW4B]|uniref:IS3 family transposase n=1 Tax=Diaphorobacter sp. HDW4B TaxID=2714925 RepID=UPI00140B0B25|nr:IS3 family transposase [Diaphorobacter sp. HDW4B]QIL69011.1 IS3 family transposase [Diaphorobacter sp. HDW4B]QIL69331.1 IS3 family transposase [Diaphorobacter sp. HDW4B]QIL69506.1 IS3 family transposase [Diaphorobacter sp. HDW4B]QIL69983.1 IS3 family transposase [Diaphorobacter sp. HDW4B]QIL72892.1 IS3 family transposase [Diaphorobacter sp. HDW4B]